jgi:hypothetical protein
MAQAEDNDLEFGVSVILLAEAMINSTLLAPF